MTDDRRLTQLTVTTYDPQKYLLVDKSTGAVYRGTSPGPWGGIGKWVNSGLYMDDENQLLQKDP